MLTEERGRVFRASHFWCSQRGWPSAPLARLPGARKEKTSNPHISRSTTGALQEQNENTPEALREHTANTKQRSKAPKTQKKTITNTEECPKGLHPHREGCALPATMTPRHPLRPHSPPLPARPSPSPAGASALRAAAKSAGAAPSQGPWRRGQQRGRTAQQTGQEGSSVGGREEGVGRQLLHPSTKCGTSSSLAALLSSSACRRSPGPSPPPIPSTPPAYPPLPRLPHLSQAAQPFSQLQHQSDRGHPLLRDLYRREVWSDTIITAGSRCS